MCQIRVNLRRWACLLAALACLLALLPLPAHAAQAASKVVRVGWYEDAYNITGKNGERSGYAYEYEQSVAAYTGWTYEYVKAGWSDLLQMMKNGEIDLMAGVSYTEDRAQDRLFSELPMGREIYYLYADLAHTDISASNLRTLNGKRIALMKTSVEAAQFYQWEEDHGLHLQYVWSNSFEQDKQQAQGREIDCVISTETPGWVEYGMSAIAQTGGSDIYFAISRTRQNLKEELDHAMRKMEFDKPFYADELYQRYLSASYTPVLSREEQDWATQHGDIRIGFLTSDAGISTYVPESGQLVGVINDYITFASDSISNQKLDFSLVGYDSMEEEVQALKDGQIDLIFHFAQNPYVAEENNFVLSNTVLTLNMAAVTAQNYFNENHANTVALLKDDLLLKWYVSYCYPDWNIVEYDSLKDAEAAVRSGENDCLLAESGEVAKYREDKRLHSVFLTQDGNVSFAVARGDVTLMSILNKTLRTIPASMLTGALPMYEASLDKVTVIDFVKDNFLVASVMLITFFGMILAVILVSLRRSRIAEANAKEAARQARKLNQKLQESQRELRAALQQAESASSAKTTFLSNVSHDIRTPMNAIVGLASLMENDLQNPGKLQGYIDKLKTASWHLLNLINEILDMSKIESGKATLNIQPFRMAEQIAQVDSVIRQQAVLRDQQFTVQVHDLLHENVEGDATRLRQVLLNILSNAVKYTGHGGSISLNVEEILRSGHLGIDFTYYRSTTTDQILSMTVPGSSGYASKKINAGKMESKGVELMVTGTPIQTKDWRWDVTLNWGKNTTRNVELDEKNKRYVFPLTTNVRVGKVVIDEGGKFGDIVSTAYKRNEDGRILVGDNGLPLIDTKSEKVIGNMMPEWTGSFGTTLSWKDIVFSALIDVRYGGQFLSMTDAYATGAGNSKRTLSGRDGMVVNGIVESTGLENTKQVTAQEYYATIAGTYPVGEEFLHDATYVKLRELSIGYTLPKIWFRNTPITNVKVSIVGRDLFNIYKAAPVNAEFAQNSQDVFQAFELAALPSTRTVGFSLNVKF